MFIHRFVFFLFVNFHFKKDSPSDGLVKYLSKKESVAVNISTRLFSIKLVAFLAIFCDFFKFLRISHSSVSQYGNDLY